MSACGTRTQYLSGMLPLLLLLTVSCGQSPRIVVVPSAGGNIVFTSSRALDGSDAANGATNIWVINSDGTSPRPLTKLTATGASSTTPVLSPSKTKIAFNSMRALDGSNAAIGAVNIWVMNTDGSNATPLTKLTTTPVNSIHAAWSPDSSKIAYDSTRALNGIDASGLSTNVWLMNADGSSSATLTAFRLAANVSPAWSSDGTKLLFESSRSLTGVDLDIAVTNIWVMNADGTSPQPFTRLNAVSSSNAAWSPDGTRIVYVSPRALDGSNSAGNAANLWIMNADGSSHRPLTFLQNSFNMTVETPVWSPDGTRIAYVSSRALDGSDNGGAVLNIWVMNADGTGQRHLTSLIAATSYQPAWSSDGRTMLFCSNRALDGTDLPNTNATANIWLMNSDGTAPRPLTRSTASGADSAGPRWLQ
jgi:Tol biopolymer transport system component